VGAVSLACLARNGHRVIGVDVDRAKLDLIAAGRTPVVEEGLAQLIAAGVASGRVSVLQDARSALLQTDLSLICVGTPSAPDGSQDQTAMVRLAKDLGAAMRDKATPHVFVFRSTLVPGTVEDVLVPLLEAESGAKDGVGFCVCYLPEFLREGSCIRDYDAPPFTIAGVSDEAGLAALRALFGHLPCEFHVTTIRAAEMIKYCCNNFHALKVAFANETARICAAMGVDPFVVMDLVARDRHLNISPAYLKPGFAFGGPCLPKDVRAMAHLGKTHDVELPVHGAIATSNHAHLEYALAKVMSSGRTRVGMIGLAFKAGTDDLRESPLVLLAERLVGVGLTLLVYAPEVQLANLMGANREFILRHVPQIGSLLRCGLDAVVAASDLLILGMSHDALLDELKRHVRRDQMILDLVGVPDGRNLGGQYAGLCW
jgi:GDP-mannose 6-dehydrogenase